MARAWMKAALAGMAVMAMTAPVHAADTIKIGVPGAHSGDLVSYGMPSLNAARIVAEEYNAKGGILGKQIEIVAEDDQCKPELGTNAATKVLSEGAVAVMGSICSGATRTASPPAFCARTRARRIFPRSCAARILPPAYRPLTNVPERAIL